MDMDAKELRRNVHEGVRLLENSKIPRINEIVELVEQDK